MKKVHKVAMHSVTRIFTQYSAQSRVLSALVACLMSSAIVVVYGHTSYPNFSRIRSLQLKKGISWFSLFSFLFPSSSITGEVVNEKFWKNHRVLLHTPTIYKFQLNPCITAQKWISWLLSHYSHFYILPVLLLEKQLTKNSEKITEYCYIHPLYHIQILAQSVHNNWSN